MIDLRQRLSELDQLEAPDMRADIDRRAAQLLAAPDEPILEPDRRPSRWRGPLIALGTAAAILIAVAAAALMLRTDPGGVTDEPAPPPTIAETAEEPTSVESAPPTTVAETAEEPISVESLTWSQIPLDQSLFSGLGSDSWYQLEVSNIVAGGPGLVAVGGGGPGGNTKYASVWTSPDGYAWSRVPYDETVFGFDLQIKGVTVGGPGLVAVGDVDVWTSVDGYTWSRIPRDPNVVHPITGDLRGVVAGDPGLVAFGESAGTGAVWTSPDGYTWTQVPHDETVFGRSSIHSVTRGGPGLVAVGVDETEWDEPHRTYAAVWTSPDGYNWTRVPHDPSVFSKGTGMAEVAVGDHGLVAVGFEGRDGWPVAAVWTSPDGFSWTRIPHDEAIFGSTYEDMSSVAAVGDGFVAVGGWGGLRVWTSPDGVTWNRMLDAEAVFGEGTSLHTVIAGGPGVVALGGMDGDRTAIWVATPTEADEPATATTTD